MFAAFDIPLSWADLLKRTAKQTSEDDWLGLAAQLAYDSILALFPAVLFVLGLASFVPLTNFINDIVGILTIGLLGAIWSSSVAVVAIIGGLNRAYDIEEGRPWSKAIDHDWATWPSHC